MSLKWEKIKEEVLQTDNKAQYIRGLLSQYDSTNKYARVYHYIGKELVKLAHGGLSKKVVRVAREEVSQWVAVVGLVVSSLCEEEEGVRSVVNKVAPHLVIAAAQLGDGEETYTLSETLYGPVSTHGTQSANCHIFAALLKSAKACQTDNPDNDGDKVRLQTKLHMLGLQYFVLCPKNPTYDNIGSKVAIILRRMNFVERREYQARLWELVAHCLDQQIGTVRLSDLLFTLARYDISDGAGDITKISNLISRYKDSLDLPTLGPLFDVTVSVCQTVDEQTLHLLHLPEDLLRTFSTTDTDTIWILLSVSQFLGTVLLRKQPTPPSFLRKQPTPPSFLPLITQMCRLMLRSPQNSLNEEACELLTHVHKNLDMEATLSVEGGFVRYAPLLHLHAVALNKDNLNSGMSREEYLAHLEHTCDLLPDITQRTQCLEVGLQFPHPHLPDHYLLRLARLLQQQGHTKDVVELLAGEEKSPDIKIYRAVCLVSRLDVDDALLLLSAITTDNEHAGSKISILITYCKFYSALKRKEPFSLPAAAEFCKDAHHLLSSTDLTDLTLTVTMFLAGLYNLTGIITACVARLANHPDTFATHLSAVPHQHPDLWHPHVRDTASTDSSMLRSVRCYVLLEEMLESGQEVYGVAEQCTSLGLEAALARLKSWKHTNMSTKSLLWKNCSVLPYLLHVLVRYIKLLSTWGSIHLTFSYLGRLEQVAKFLRADYWICVHSHMLITLQLLVSATIKSPPTPPTVCGTTTPDPVTMPTTPSDRFVAEHVYHQQCLGVEFDLLSSEISGRDGDVRSRDLSISELPAPYLLQLVVLKLTLVWGRVSDPVSELADCYQVLKTNSGPGAVPGTNSGPGAVPGTNSGPGAVPGTNTEVRKLCCAWLELLSSYHTTGIPKPKSRGGRGARKRVKSNTDHVSEGLKACLGLEPVVVQRALLKHKIKRDVGWADVEHHNNISLRHQLHLMLQHRLTVPTPDDTTIHDSQITELPETWTICSITKLHNTLYIGQQTSRSEHLATRELPYTVKSLGIPTSHDSCVDEMERIIQSNDDTMTKVNDKVGFWKSRYALNENLQSLLDKLESDWLGPWKGLLFGRATDPGYYRAIGKSAAQLRKSIKSKFKVTVSKFLSEYVLDCYSVLSEDHITELFPSVSRVADLLTMLHELAPAASPARHPTLLSLDRDTAALPWESCRVYKHQAISRVPSAHFALHILTLRTLPLKINKADTYYILNPSNDLPSTQSLFESWLVEQEWEGVAAKAPSLAQYETALASDLFLYLGHGDGKTFLRGKSVQDIESKAVALLMGCSSGKVKHTPYGGIGTPIEYLLSGCPAVVGYMWNVTDRDCDRFSKRLLEMWLSEGSSTSLIYLINPAREACKLEYLVGAAPVLYGVPDILTRS